MATGFCAAEQFLRRATKLKSTSFYGLGNWHSIASGIRGSDMKVPRRQFLHLATSAAVLPTVSRIARAQAYPSRSIRLVIPFPPGGAYDAVGRPWADKMKHLLGTVVVENIGGASGSLGAAA